MIDQKVFYALRSFIASIAKYSFAVTLLCIAFTANGQTTIYKCIDERGKPFFSNTGGADCKNLNMLNFSNVEKIPKIGMTKDDVTTIWGKPVREALI